MKPQKPAMGISQTANYSEAKAFKIECDCHSSDHAVNMWIEVDGDSETEDVQVAFYVDTWTPFWVKGFSRFKTAWNILVYGINRQEHHLILAPQAALNLAEVLKTTVTQLDKR